jgi:hypothetical protein
MGVYLELGGEKSPVDRFGEICLGAVCGHLCCLGGFYWCRIWAFAPGKFRILSALIVSVAFLGSLALLSWPCRDRPFSPTVLTAWAAVMGFPLIRGAGLSAGGVFLLAVLLCATLLKGRRLWWGVFLSLVAALLAYSQWGALSGGGWLLSMAAIGELYAERGQEAADIGQPEQLELTPKAEIFWRGFAQLYASCAKGEGEKFSRKVLADTASVVKKCEGVLQTGSEHRGVYQFPDEARCRQCHQVLLEYAKQLDGVLGSVDAPGIELIFKPR